MSGPLTPVSGGVKIEATGPAERDPRAELKKLAQEMEGMFLRQLFQAMRESVHHDNPAEVSAGEELFTSLFDEHLASQAAQRLERGMGAALYRQLVRGLDAQTLKPPTRSGA